MANLTPSNSAPRPGNATEDPKVSAAYIADTYGYGIDEERLRYCFDPVGKFDAEDANSLVRWIGNNMAQPIVRGPGVMRLRGTETLLAQVAALDIWDEDGLSLQIPERRQAAIVENQHRKAGYVAQAITTASQEYLAAMGADVEITDTPIELKLPSIILQSGKTALSLAAADQEKFDLKDIFTQVDKSVSAITAGWRSRYSTNAEATLDIRRFEAYFRAGIEAFMDPRGEYLGRTAPVTPLVAKKVLELNGIDAPTATDSARSLTLLTRTTDVEGTRVPRTKFLKDVANYPGMAGENATLVLSADFAPANNPVDWKNEEGLLVPVTMLRKELLDAISRKDGNTDLDLVAAVHAISSIAKDGMTETHAIKHSFPADVRFELAQQVKWLVLKQEGFI